MKYPNIKFKIENGTTLEICRLLKSGEVDIAICNFPMDDPTLEQSHVLTFMIFLFVVKNISIFYRIQ